MYQTANNFDIKQKRHGIFVLLYVLLFFIIFVLHQHQTRSGKIKANKTQQISVKTQVFFVKSEPRLQDYKTTTASPNKSFYITFLDIFF